MSEETLLTHRVTEQATLTKEPLDNNVNDNIQKKMGTKESQAQEDAKQQMDESEKWRKYKALSFVDKYRMEKSAKVPSIVHRKFARAMNIFVVFITTCMCYLGHRWMIKAFVVRYVHGWFGWDIEEWTYYGKVFVYFVYTNALANWVCVKFYHSVIKDNGDRPNRNKPLWDAHGNDLNNPNSQEKRIFRVNGRALDEAESSKYLNEQKVLSWKHCHICDLIVPPRSHHCKVCRRCIYKRSHHCYLTNTCIGFTNQRYFVIMSFYLALGCFGAMWGGCYYVLSHPQYSTSSWWDFSLPVTIYEWLWTGKYEHQHVLALMVGYTLLWVGPLTLGFFVWESYLICSGMTPHEVNKELKIKNVETLGERLRSVFGDFWMLNILFPAVIIFRQRDDGTEWPKMKIHYRYQPQEIPEKTEKNL